jgi:steroid 5-alpha reductase family enzyme
MDNVDIVRLVILGWLVAAGVMLALWLWHLRLRNVGVVDLGWTLSVVLVAILDAALGSGDLTRRWLIAAMFAVWGVRLGGYLLRDRVLGRPEDPRYIDLRERQSPVAAGSFFLFFQAQAVLAVLLSAPALIASLNPSPGLAAIEIGAAGLWAVALTGEAIADRQLERFKTRRDTKGRTCREGLWRYSRHPNYFFEWLIWIAYASFAAASPWGGLAFLCPLLIFYLLFRVTGIPATEAQALRTKGDDYRRYQETTSVFVPWFPRGAA